MRKRVEAAASGFAARELNPGMAEFPLAGAVLARVMKVVDYRVSHGRWSARRTLAFVTVSSLALWAVIITGALWAAHAIRWAH